MASANLFVDVIVITSVPVSGERAAESHRLNVISTSGSRLLFLVVFVVIITIFFLFSSIVGATGKTRGFLRDAALRAKSVNIVTRF